MAYNLSEKAIAEKYEDLLFTKVMALYAEEESEKILSELGEETAETKAVQKLFDKKERSENLRTLWKYSKKILQFAAMIVFVAVVSVSSVVVASAEVRETVAEAIYHLMIKDYGRYTEVSIGDSTGFIDPEIYDWEGAYAPTYMPEGFVFSEKQELPSKTMIVYCRENEHFIISQATSGITRVDTENAQVVKNIMIGDSEALYVEKNNFTYIVWMNRDVFLSVTGKISPDEAVKIAEGLKPIGKTETEESAEEYKFVDPELYDWEGAYAPTYVPEGFVLEELSKNKSQKIAKYFSDNAYISFSQAYNVVKQIDTENAERNEDIQIGDSTGLLVVNDEITYVLWNIGDTVFHIYGTCETDEIIQMAQGIKPISNSAEEPEYTFVDPELYDWEGAYAPTYVPKGFSFGEMQDLDSQKIVTYFSETNFISFLQAQNVIQQKDTENADRVEQIKINNSEGLMVVKGELTSITWNIGDTLLTVLGNYSTEELINMAQSIKPISNSASEPEEEYTFVDPEIYTWENAYGLTYMAENYNLYSAKDLEHNRIVNYMQGEKYISFVQYIDTTVATDTEDADIVKEIQIGKSKGFLVVKDDWSCVFYSVEDILLQVSGTAPTEEIIKVAEGIRPIN